MCVCTRVSARWLGALAGVCTHAGKCSWIVPQLSVCMWLCVVLHLGPAVVCGSTVVTIRPFFFLRILSAGWKLFINRCFLLVPFLSVFPGLFLFTSHSALVSSTILLLSCSPCVLLMVVTSEEREDSLSPCCWDNWRCQLEPGIAPRSGLNIRHTLLPYAQHTSPTNRPMARFSPCLSANQRRDDD